MIPHGSRLYPPKPNGLGNSSRAGASPHALSQPGSFCSFLFHIAWLPSSPCAFNDFRMKYKRFLVAGLVPVLAAVTAVTSAGAATAARTAPSAARIPNSPIKHVIEVMIENHTFDNLFGSFPGADGIPANASFLNPNAYYDSAPNVSPVHATPNEGDVQGAINNSRVAWRPRPALCPSTPRSTGRSR